MGTQVRHTDDTAQTLHASNQTQYQTRYQPQVTIGAFFLLATSLFFVAHIIAQLAWPGYNVFQYDVSALGVTQCGTYTNGAGGLTFYACSPLHVVMNAGFIVNGIGASVGIVLTRSIWPRRRLTRVGVALVAVSGLGAILAGFAPANLHFGLHVLGALMNFLAAGTGILLLGFGARRYDGRLAAWSLLLGGLTIAGFLLYNGQAFLGLGPGGMERVLGFSPVIWSIGLGIIVLIRTRRASDIAPAS